MSRHCWCGNAALRPFSPDYFACDDCGTLVSSFEHQTDVSRVRVDEADLYGKDYWFGHMEQDLGFPNIIERARLDLIERCPHWAKALLKYRTPPGRVLELGSAHGGLVALLRWAGFDASGLELSPAIVELARDLFGIPMLCGPIEDQSIAPRTLDVVAMMDVLEHLPDPVATMRHVTGLIADDGFVLVQTPRYREGQSFEALVDSGDRFVEQLKANEHLYLFSERSVATLFAGVGLHHLQFEPALFTHYDMFFAVGRQPFRQVGCVAREQALTASSGGRLALAVLDLHDRLLSSVTRAAFDASEADRAARLAVIERQGTEIGDLTHTVTHQRAELESLRAAFEAAEADRAARLGVIEEQGRRLGEVGHERVALEAESKALRQAFDEAEADRAARLDVIEEARRQLEAAAAARLLLDRQVDALRTACATFETERSAGVEVIEDQRRTLDESAAMNRNLQAKIEQVSAELFTSERTIVDIRERIDSLQVRNDALERLSRRGILQLILDRLRGRG